MDRWQQKLLEELVERLRERPSTHNTADIAEIQEFVTNWGAGKCI